MRKFIESLENRALLSATAAATLSADHGLITTDGGAIKSDLASLVAADKVNDAAIAADLKGVVPATNRRLLAALSGDEAKSKAALIGAVAELVARADAVVIRSVAAGDALLTKWTAREQAIVTADIAALGTVSTGPLATLQADLASATVLNAVNALGSANPSVANLAGAINTQESDAATLKTTIGAAATTFQADLATLATDLGAVPATPTIVNVVGNYSGSARQTAGGSGGKITTLKVYITSEAADGTFSGTVTTTNNNGVNQNTMTGAVTAAGAFSAVVTDGSGGATTLSATVKGKTIVGTYSGNGSSGTFSVTRT